MLNLLMTENAFIYLDQRKFIVVEIIYPGREGEGGREREGEREREGGRERERDVSNQQTIFQSDNHFHIDYKMRDEY